VENISKEEVARRSVAQAESTAAEHARPSPLEALKWLQSNGKLTPKTSSPPNEVEEFPAHYLDDVRVRLLPQ
jgi:hypothetical protein